METAATREKAEPSKPLHAVCGIGRAWIVGVSVMVSTAGQDQPAASRYMAYVTNARALF